MCPTSKRSSAVPSPRTSAPSAVNRTTCPSTTNVSPTSSSAPSALEPIPGPRVVDLDHRIGSPQLRSQVAGSQHGHCHRGQTRTTHHPIEARQVQGAISDVPSSALPTRIGMIV